MMSIIALLELHFIEDTLAEARTVMRRVLTETRSFDGNQEIAVWVDSDDETRWTILERWASAEHDQAYREFRAGPGKISDLAPLLAEAPRLRKFTLDESL